MAKQKEKKNITLEEKLNNALVPVQEQPYEIPENWCWVRLQNLCEIPITDGTHQTPTYCEESEGIPFISSKDVTSQYIKWDNIKYITKELHEELYKRIAPKKNDILLAKNGTTGVAALVETDKVFDIYVTLALLRPNINIVHPYYLYYMVNSIVCKKQFDEHLTGIGLPNLHLRDIKVTNIPLPPLPEQQRIVDLIERLFAKLDEAKEKVQTAIDSFELRKAAILHKAFTGELTKVWRAENGKLRDENGELGKTHFNKGSNETTGEDALKPLLEEGWLRSNRGGDGIRSKSCSIEQSSSQPDWIATQSTTACNDESTGGSDTLSLNKVYSSSVTTPTCHRQVTSPQGEALETADQTNANTTEGLPLGWQRKSIASICKSLKYGTSKKSEKSGKVVVLRMGNLQNGEIDWTDLAYTNDAEDIEKYKLQNGDVLFNRTNSAVLVGKTSIYRGEFPAIYAGYLIKLDYDHNIILGDFLNYALNTLEAKHYCNSVKTDGVNQSNINAQKIGAYQIPLPPLPEQKEIVRILDTLLAKSDKAKELAENALENIETLKKTILAKAFRGLLGTNRAEEASSIELLKDVL